MLWVDDDFVTLLDLESLDPEVRTMAESDPPIAIVGPSGCIRRGKEMAQRRIQRFLSFANLSSGDLRFQNVNLPMTITNLVSSYAGLAQLVVTGQSWDNWTQLKAYVVACSLLKLYESAVKKSADRYSDRKDAITDDINRDYWPNFKRFGMPLCLNPLEAPGAILNQCGLFTEDNAYAVNGAGGTQQKSYYVAVTWVGSMYVSPTNKRNGESFRSALISVDVNVGEVIEVNIAGLKPPNGIQPPFTLADSSYSPGVAVGWNVWVGEVPADSANAVDNPVLYRQNTNVLALTADTFTLAADPVLSGERNDLGQYANVIMEVSTNLVRA